MRTALALLLSSSVALAQFGLDIGEPGFVGALTQSATPPSSYTAYATTFAGDNQCWMERDGDFTSIADGKQGTVSMWVYLSGDDGVLQQLFVGTSGRPGLNRQAGNTLRMSLFTAAGVEVIRINSSSTLTADASWHHVIVTWDKTVDNKAYMYLDGSDVTSIGIFTSDGEGNTDDLDYTRTDWAIGNNVGGGSSTDVNGCIAEVWFNTEYIDLTSSTVREKFRSAGGEPVDLGSDGSTPTGNTPFLYLKSPYTSFESNSGSGGDMVKKGTTAFTECTAP